MHHMIFSSSRVFPAPRRWRQLCLPLGVLLAAQLGVRASAATVIASEAGPAHVKSLMTVENGKARMQSEPSNYILIDPAAGHYLYIIPESEQTVNMSSPPPIAPGQSAKLSPSAATRLVHKGAGPKIAGYPTQHYQLFANGTLCLNTYLSREAVTRGQLKDFLAGFSKLQSKQKQDYQAAGRQYAPCEDAQEALMARYPDLGLAMRTIGADGQLLQEVVRIQTGAHVSDRFFQAPQGYAELTHEQFLRQMEGMDAAPQASPAGKPGGTS